MDNEQFAVKLQETTDRSLRNEGRIEKLEDEHLAIHDLATSVAVMAEQLKTMNANVTNLASKVDEIESKPSKRWDSMVDKTVWAILAAVIAFLLGRVGL